MTFRKLSFTALMLLCFGVALVSKAQTKKSGNKQAADTATYIEPTYQAGSLLKIKPAYSTAAVSTVSGPELYKTPAANITNAMYGKLSGLTVRQGSGEPGYDAASLAIRGIGTYDANAITILVDGFQVTPTYFQYMSASEIESVTILKDAAALATFGMRGANGVISIITKRGHVGKPTVQMQVRSGVQQASNIDKPLGSYDYARLYNQAISNDNYVQNGYQFVYTPKYTDAQLQAYKSGTGTNVDWFNQVLKKSTPYTDANVVFTGGDTTTKYGLVLDYLNNNGLYNVDNGTSSSNAQIQRFNLRSNLDFKFFKIFEAKVDLGGRIEDRRYPNFNGGTLWTNMAAYPSNIYPVKDPATGAWSGTTLFPNNPVASIRALGWASTHDRTLQANFSLKENLDFITPGLYLQEAVSFNTWTRNSASKTATYSRFYNGVQTTTDKSSDIISNGTTPTSQYDWKQSNITAGYNHTFGKGVFTSAINYFASGLLEDWNGADNGAGSNTVNNIYHHYENLAGRFNYTYNNKYVAELGFAYSGSDNFALGNRWGAYPSISAAWIISNEDFLKGNTVVSQLKLRASAGKSGNESSNNGRYLYQQYYAGNGSYYTGDNGLTTNSGITASYIANPNIFAEKSLKYNVGVDAVLFNKLSVTADVFMDKRSGINTYNNNLYLATLGTASMYQNIGKVTNQGVELSANFSDKVGAFSYNIGAMASYTKNRIDYAAEVAPVNSFSRATGLPIGSPMGLVADGFYQITDFNANGTLKTGQATPAFGAVQPGDIKYKDLDGSGFIDQNDITKIGNPSFPSLYYSFNAGASYKGFDVQIFFQGSAGGDYNLLSAPTQNIAFVNNANAFSIANGAWAYYPDKGIDTRNTANYPRLTTQANANNYQNSTFWMKKNSFLRIRNAELGYTLPNALLKKAHLTNLRIFVSATNPKTWSSLLKNYNLDPETPTGYPGLKSYTSGLTLLF